MRSLVILGRQPELGLAELESLLGADVLTPIQGGAALVDLDTSQIPFARLGGSIKLAKVLMTLDTTDWFVIEKHLMKTLPEHLEHVPDGKLTIGLSLYGLPVTLKTLERTTLTLKKIIKQTGRPARIVPNKTLEISTPQIIHNKLTSPNGWELVFFKVGNRTILAQTTDIQDIEAYSARDQARPKRDARVGMLPPKLAQIIINLATGQVKIESRKSKIVEVLPPISESPTVILDPFCGTGVILQEAALMGIDSYGTDVEPRMVEYSIANMHWLRERFNCDTHVTIELGDATSHQWRDASTITAVACEGYLGTPFSTVPDDKHVRESIDVCERIMSGTLRNLTRQLAPGTRLCIGMPAWFIDGRVRHLPALHSLDAYGFTRIGFIHATNADLIYHREDQIVGRELVVLVKN